jgi:hypothetical protein
MKYILIWSLSCSFLFSDINTTIEIAGRLSVKGIGEHTYLAIEEKSSGKVYKIQNGKAFGLFGHQNEKVKLHVKVVQQEIGPGFPAMIRILSCYNLSKKVSCLISN